MYNVYLYGMITASTVHILDQSFVFPQANQYAEIGESLPSVGGEAVNSAIMLAKLGINTKLDGNWLNPATAPQTLALLRPFGIDTSRLFIVDGFGTQEIVIVDKTTRTIFANYAQFHAGKKQWNSPMEEDVIAADMIGLDPYFRHDAPLLAQLCVKHNKPYVTLDCRYDEFMAQQAAAVIISHELREQAYQSANIDTLFGLYLDACQGLVIFTFGSHNLWYARRGETPKQFAPFEIDPIDTTGAGDSFRAGIIYGLLQNWSDERVIQFASAVAANVCLTRPHALNAPGLGAILDFMQQRGL